MSDHTRAPRTTRIVGHGGEPSTVDPDLPVPGPCCAPGTVRQLCDECWPPLRDHALRKGMPAYMVGQLRNRMYRLSKAEAAEFDRTAIKVHVVPGATDSNVLDTLAAKQSVAEAILKG